MAKTVAIVLAAISLLSIAPLATFAQSIPSISVPTPPYQWLVYVIVAALSIIVLLLATNSLQKPGSFASLPIYLFFSLTIFVVFFILSISFFPTDFFGRSFPISTGTFSDAQNQTQWVLNIGGNPDDPNSSGLQIPIYVIIAGILGAYIRYLYIGISEFKESFQQKLNSFEESYDSFFRALDDYNTHTRSTISPWPPATPLLLKIIHPGAYLDAKQEYDRNFEYEVTLLEEGWEATKENARFGRIRPMPAPGVPPPPEPEVPEPTYEIPNPEYDNTIDESLDNPRKLTISWREKRRILWSNIRKAQSDFKKHRFTIGLEITTHILKTVGSFFLGPLLAVLAWLLLSIAGTDDLLTFALVSFAIGLTTKIIITRVMNFVGERIADETPAASTTPAATRTDTSTTQAPSIVIDPNQARAGQLLSVEGNGFRANSRITLEYAGNGDAANNTIQAFRETFQSSSEGKFGFRFWLSPSLLAGTYNLSVKDDNSKSASGRFTVS